MWKVQLYIALTHNDVTSPALRKQWVSFAFCSRMTASFKSPSNNIWQRSCLVFLVFFPASSSVPPSFLFQLLLTFICTCNPTEHTLLLYLKHTHQYTAGSMKEASVFRKQKLLFLQNGSKASGWSSLCQRERKGTDEPRIRYAECVCHLHLISYLCFDFMWLVRELNMTALVWMCL